MAGTPLGLDPTLGPVMAAGTRTTKASCAETTCPPHRTPAAPLLQGHLLSMGAGRKFATLPGETFQVDGRGVCDSPRTCLEVLFVPRISFRWQSPSWTPSRPYLQCISPLIRLQGAIFLGFGPDWRFSTLLLSPTPLRASTYDPFLVCPFRYVTPRLYGHAAPPSWWGLVVRATTLMHPEVSLVRPVGDTVPPLSLPHTLSRALTSISNLLRDLVLRVGLYPHGQGPVVGAACLCCSTWFQPPSPRCPICACNDVLALHGASPDQDKWLSCFTELIEGLRHLFHPLLGVPPLVGVCSLLTLHAWLRQVHRRHHRWSPLCLPSPPILLVGTTLCIWNVLSQPVTSLLRAIGWDCPLH